MDIKIIIEIDLEFLEECGIVGGLLSGEEV